MVAELTSGPLIVLELSKGSTSSSVVNEFRTICGPSDPQIAKVIRAQTLRAKYGQDKIKNAVHCTDLEEDGPLECEYFFKILQQ